MLPPSSPRARRARRAGLGLAAVALIAWFGWLGWQGLAGSAAPAPVAAGASASLPDAQGEGWTLVQDRHCLRCHGMEQTHVGPGFAQVAQRYRGEPDAPAYLARKIREGSAGVWGRKLMPRQPGISAEQAQAIAGWLLARPDPAP